MNVEGMKPKENHETFLARLQLKMRPVDVKMVDFAYDMAKYGHREQLRDSGERYFEHLRETALIMIDEFGIYDPELLCASLLHDMLEDNYLVVDNRLEVTFTRRVSEIVKAVTKPKKNDPRFTSDHQRHVWYFEQVSQSTCDVKIIKLADRLHNVRTLANCNAEKRARKLAETKDRYIPLVVSVEDAYPELGRKIRLAFDAAISEQEVSLTA